MQELKLNPTQLTYLKKCVAEKEVRFTDKKVPANLSMKYTDITEQEKADLKRKLDKLKPKPVEV